MSHNKNTLVSKAQALGLMSYLILNTEYHCTMSVSKNFVDLVVHCDSLAEVVHIEFLTRQFSVDGCTFESQWVEESNHFFTRIEFPTCFSNQK